ncbi:MAG: hypothetical protein E6Y86_00090 [Slackia sp.]|uniref:hypothetical protein n=1 Tax=Slackia exigua TaxID=84109 RepID=UPI00210E2B92|nr:hypothetical protein [Slackia exigua]MCQ5091345.1 hypothetical protein [Slackia exigua]MDU6010440.1 hypothetical protein [Slackia sp.]
MPAMILARLYRILPLLVILAILALGIYAFVSWRYTPNRAKEVVIKLFVVLNAGLAAFFALATLYALLEGNAFVTDFFLTCALMMLVLLVATLGCRRRFLKNHPHYAWKRTDASAPERLRELLKKR